MALSRLLQRLVGCVSGLDLVGGVCGHELGDESDRDGGFGELFEEGRLKAKNP
jgi:hypothetical protein